MATYQTPGWLAQAQGELEAEREARPTTPRFTTAVQGGRTVRMDSWTGRAWVLWPEITPAQAHAEDDPPNYYWLPVADPPADGEDGGEDA